MNLLKIKDPSFLKDLSIKELEQLSKEIREFLIDKTSICGGHLGGNLGNVELTIALERFFDDGTKFIFDVGHQCYTHKILTGRAKDFDTLRQNGGLSGFPLRSESEYDSWDVAHASTSLAAQAGYLEAGINCISIIGDGALTGGEALEALNYLSVLKKKAIIILNDNKFSISKNVGFINKFLDYLRSTSGYNDLSSKNRENFFLKSIKNGIKRLFYKNNVLDAMGFKYYGPINGHDFNEMFKYFEYAKKQDRPVILHICTQKGRGYEFSEKDDVGAWHCVGPFNRENGEQKKNPDLETFSEGAASFMIEFEKKYPNTRVVMPAMTYNTNMLPLKNAIKEKYIDTGITEQFATTFAASLSLNGVYTLLPIYSSFLQRAYDQVHQDICMQNLHTVILVCNSGIVPSNGKTHQGIYDISYLSTIPNLKILAPKDIEELYMMMEYAFLKYNGPIAIHIPSESTKRVNFVKAFENDINLNWVTTNNVKELKGHLITYSTLVDKIKDYALEINVEVINARCIRPLDTNKLDEINDGKPIFVYEDAPSETSLYSYVLNYLNKAGMKSKVYPLGFPLDYVDIGTIDELRKVYKLDPLSIKERIKELL